MFNSTDMAPCPKCNGNGTKGCSKCGHTGTATGYVKHQRKLAAERERNQILRDMCGVSARAAKEDMGL